MRTLPNVVKFRLAGFPLDALDQKRMRRLRRTSDRMGVPIPDLISEIVGQVVETWLAEAELPNKIVKFPAAGRKVRGILRRTYSGRGTQKYNRPLSKAHSQS